MPRAVTITGYGPPSVLHLDEVEIAGPGPRQVRAAEVHSGLEAGTLRGKVVLKT
jgi:hypothetical protein